MSSYEPGSSFWVSARSAEPVHDLKRCGVIATATSSKESHARSMSASVQGADCRREALAQPVGDLLRVRMILIDLRSVDHHRLLFDYSRYRMSPRPGTATR
jgi:hypothetical protein